jgi:hypothetical protein
MSLDRAAAETSIVRHVAEPLGLGPIEAAEAIIEVANANMADAVRLISIRRGYDPRDSPRRFDGAGGAVLSKISRSAARTAESGDHVRARLPASTSADLAEMFPGADATPDRRSSRGSRRRRATGRHEGVPTIGEPARGSRCAISVSGASPVPSTALGSAGAEAVSRGTSGYSYRRRCPVRSPPSSRRSAHAEAGVRSAPPARLRPAAPGASADEAVARSRRRCTCEQLPAGADRRPASSTN